MWDLFGVGIDILLKNYLYVDADMGIEWRSDVPTPPLTSNVYLKDEIRCSKRDDFVPLYRIPWRCFEITLAYPEMLAVSSLLIKVPLREM